MKARLAHTNGKLQKVKLIKNKFGIGHDGYQFPDGLIFRVEHCTTQEVKNPPRKWVHNPLDKKHVTRRYICPVCKFDTFSFQVFHKHKRDNNH